MRGRDSQSVSNASPITHTSAATDVSETAALQLEMRKIKERRDMLQASRRDTSLNSSRSNSRVRHDPPGATHEQVIPPEHVRRERQVATVDREMKEAMKRSWHADPTLVSGYFLTAEVGRGGTFPRAKRFQQPVGMKSRYYLSNETQKMQSSQLRGDRQHLIASSRGRVGTNVTTHWDDSRGGGAPGPGAYTPRLRFLSR